MYAAASRAFVPLACNWMILTRTDVAAASDLAGASAMAIMASSIKKVHLPCSETCLRRQRQTLCSVFHPVASARPILDGLASRRNSSWVYYICNARHVSYTSSSKFLHMPFLLPACLRDLRLVSPLSDEIQQRPPISPRSHPTLTWSPRRPSTSAHENSTPTYCLS
jgi:hypothetical protein